MFELIEMFVEIVELLRAFRPVRRREQRKRRYSERQRIVHREIELGANENNGRNVAPSILLLSIDRSNRK
mgnify:CR=1 FL=1